MSDLLINFTAGYICGILAVYLFHVIVLPIALGVSPKHGFLAMMRPDQVGVGLRISTEEVEP